jgi:hypothetical protein
MGEVRRASINYRSSLLLKTIIEMIITILKEKNKFTDILNQKKLQTCRICDKPAICNSYVCYKKKHQKFDCYSCEERYCQQHWRIYFNKSMKR